MTKIKHQKMRLKQKDRPICAIYAFANGFLNKDNEKNNWQDSIDRIWQLSLCNIPKGRKVVTNACQLKYSLFGEFFSSCNLESFLEEQKDRILLELQKADPKIKNYYVSPLSKLNKISENQNEFYLIPIDSGHNCELKHCNLEHKLNRYNLHWICLKYDNNGMKIINSADNCEAERRAKRNLDRTMLNWIRSIIWKIKNFSQLEKLSDDMNKRRSRRSDNDFDFKIWAEDHKKLKDNYDDVKSLSNNIDEVIDKDQFKYVFSKSDFYIIKITFERA